ncbi:MAG TPA: alpha/beta fold hydrolase [Streptosporangiaceae bacterium]|nr:alpha/beta fold hydrolase [Streptosporangiaceae bacterium]
MRTRLRLVALIRLEVVTMASRQPGRAAAGPRCRWRRPWRWAALLAVAALAATGCAATSSAPPSSSLPKTTLTACTVDKLPADCGKVWVPQDWAHPDGPAMPLEVVVLPATAASHPAAPLFYLAGTGGTAVGVGDSVLNGLDWAAQAFSQLNQTMNLVFVEQRGTPGSGLQTCPGLEDWLASPATIQAAARHCLASVSRDPRHDTTTSAVRDLDRVRQALGYNEINIYGVSYGVTMGLAYLQRYSDHVRAAVLDSGSLLPVPEEQLDAVHAQRAFDQLASRCAATPACSRSYHPAADLAAVVGRLTARPARVTLPGPGGRHQAVTLTAPMVTGWVDTQLSSIQTAVLLPAALHALALGRWSQVIAKSGVTTADLTGGPVSLQDVTVRCSDAWAAMNPATVGQQGPSVFASEVTIKANGFRALCAAWPHDPGASGTVRSDVPIVFLNGSADPGDPPASVAGARATMPNALLVTVPGIGHWTLGWNPDPVCLLAATTAFIQAGQPASPAAWNACTRALAAEPVPFPAP